MKKQILIIGAGLVGITITAQNKSFVNAPFHPLSLKTLTNHGAKTIHPGQPATAPYNASQLKTSSTTYWVPSLEERYSYNNITNQWQLTDSTRYYYHSVPAAWNGLQKYFLNYDIQNSQLNKDTFDYNSNGQVTLLKKYMSNNLSTPSYTPSYMEKTRYNSNGNVKGKTRYNWQWDFANCMSGGMGYKMMYSGLDTIIYNANNKYIEEQRQSYNSSSCSFMPSWKDVYVRNSSDLVTEQTGYNFTSGNWVPTSKLLFFYHSNDSLNYLYSLNYNTSTFSFDSSTKYTNISFQWYDKYDLNNSIVKAYTTYTYNSVNQQHELASKYQTTYDNKGNKIQDIFCTWNGSTFDTTFIRKRVYYYQGSTSAIDSIIVYQKTGISSPLQLFEKYIYKGNIQVTGIYNENNRETFRMYPVPASSVLNISSINKTKINSVTITDINGRIIQQIHNINQPAHLINIENLQSGVYLINITDDKDNVYHSKFVKE